MNSKGFTMVELLVAMAIMGLLIIMAFPTIRAIRANNTETKYEEYGKSAISAAKIYIDSYSDDFFDPEQNSQYKSLPFRDLVKKDLLKDINVSDSSCINGSSVRIVKYNSDYDYCLDLHCTSGSKEVYTETDRKGSCKDFNSKIKKVTYIYKDESTYAPYIIDVFVGDDNYQLLDPARMNFPFTSNKETFKGWSLDPKPNASSKIYKPGSIYPSKIDSDITFYAYTEKWKYKINYKKNSDGTYLGSMDSKTCTVGKECKLDPISFSREGYHFIKWQKDSNTTFSDKDDVKTSIGDKVTYDGEQINLTAIFEINTYTVTLSAGPGISSISLDGNMSVLSKTVTHGTEIKISASVPNYWQFEQWSSDYKLKDDTITVTKPLNLVATARKNILIVYYNLNGGTLKPGKLQKCPVEAGCKHSECVWQPGWKSHNRCLGSSTNRVFFSGYNDVYDVPNGWATDGVRDYSKSADGTLYAKRKGKTATGKWICGGTNVAFSEDKKFSTPLKLVQKCGSGFDNIFKQSDLTIELFAQWN